MSTSAARTTVLDVASSWLGTPFHNNQRLKGIGVDCAHFLAAVYVEAGVIADFPIEAYSPQFMLHRDEPLFESYVLRFAHEIGEAEAQPADVVLYQVGRSFAHGGIVVEWPRAVIHAFKTYRMVAETEGHVADLMGRKTKFFSFW